MYSHQRLTKPDSSPGLVTSFPPRRIQASPQTEPTPETAKRDLKAERERAKRLGHKFSEIPLLSPERPEPSFTSLIQRSAAIGVLGGGALVGASTTATGTATGTVATGGLAAASGVSGGLVLVGVLVVGGTLVLGVYALGAMTSVPTGDPETWPKPNPQPGPPPQAPGQRLQIAPLPPGQDPSELPTYTPEQLGMTQAEAMRFVSQESIPGQNPTGIREDLIPMTGDLDTQLPPTQEKDPAQSQIYTNDPVQDIPAQIPGYSDERGQQFSEDYILEARRNSKREQYLGRTPSKNSKTGREVLERMKQEGTARTTQDGKIEIYHKESQSWYPIEQCDMGHTCDAVNYWNSEGYKHGAKSQEVREWMLDPNNYELEPSSINRSRGAKLKENYKEL